MDVALGLLLEVGVEALEALTRSSGLSVTVGGFAAAVVSLAVVSVLVWAVCCGCGWEGLAGREFDWVGALAIRELLTERPAGGLSAAIEVVDTSPWPVIRRLSALVAFRLGKKVA